MHLKVNQKGVKKYLELNENENKNVRICGTKLKQYLKENNIQYKNLQRGKLNKLKVTRRKDINIRTNK